MPKNKEKDQKKQKNPKLIFEFNRKEGTHSFEAKGISGMEMLLAYQTLKDKIEKTSDMSVELVMMMALAHQKSESKKEEK